MYKFPEILGATLEGISTNKATYVGMSDDSKVLEVVGTSLVFDSGAFVIENPYKAVGVENLIDLVGNKVVGAYSNSDEIKLVFENGASISVSMKEADFVGPEAASFLPNRGNVIVFN